MKNELPLKQKVGCYKNENVENNIIDVHQRIGNRLFNNTFCMHFMFNKLGAAQLLLWMNDTA